MRPLFDEQLETLNEDMTRMGMFCETSIRTASDALIRHDLKEAAQLSEYESQAGQMRSSIENTCLQLLLQQQPVARDLRRISAALKMVTDMNRIVVQSEDIAEIVTMNTITVLPERLPVKSMSEHVIGMVSRSIDAFVRNDISLAQSVIDDDDIVDGEFDETRVILTQMLQLPDTDGNAVLDLLMVAKYLERIGDHAVNIGRWVLFSITGRHEGV